MPVVNAHALDLAERHAVTPDVRAVGCPVHIDVAVYAAGPDAGESDAVVAPISCDLLWRFRLMTFRTLKSLSVTYRRHDADM